MVSDASHRGLPADETEVFRLILDNITDLVAIVDANGKRLYNSPSYHKVLDQTKTLEGTDSFGEVHPDDRAPLKRAFDETIRTGVGRRAEYRFLRKDGNIRHIESEGNVIKGQTDGPPKVVLVSRDITERKKAELEIRTAYENLKEAQAQLVQSEKLASIGQFASGIVHDLKNPIGIVTTGTEFLQKMEQQGKSDPATLAKVIVLMQEAANRANKMVHGLLNLARRSDVKLTPGDVNAVVSSSVELIKRENPPESIKISTELTDGASLVPIDQDQMQQVLINLISNAVQAMPEDGGEVRAITSLRPVGPDTPRVGRRAMDFFRPGDRTMVIEIADTGTGIPEDKLQKIWEPFFTTKPRGQGTGLGLAIVRSMVESHRGVIQVESQAGKGTTFRITLPIPSADKAKSA